MKRSLKKIAGSGGGGYRSKNRSRPETFGPKRGTLHRRMMTLTLAPSRFCWLFPQAEALFQHDGSEMTCTCFMFLRPTNMAHKLLMLWTKNIVDKKSTKNQVSTSARPHVTPPIPNAYIATIVPRGVLITDRLFGVYESRRSVDL